MSFNSLFPLPLGSKPGLWTYASSAFSRLMSVTFLPVVCEVPFNSLSRN